MKTTPFPLGSGITRAIKCISAALMLAASTSAFAAPRGEVKVSLGGNVLAVGNDNALKLYSNHEVHASTSYNYDLNAYLLGKPGTKFGNAFPTSTPLSIFLESLQPGSSSLLKGNFPNPDGTLPCTLFDNKFVGTKKLKGIGLVELKVRVKAEILESGKCVVSVKMTSDTRKSLGTIKILGGSKFAVSSAPIITFRRTNLSVEETQGFINVPVWRLLNKRGSYSVNYTVTAAAGVLGFESSNGTVTFPDGDRTEYIRVDLPNPPTMDGKRSFSIELSNPDGGAALGEVTVITVTIKDPAI